MTGFRRIHAVLIAVTTTALGVGAVGAGSLISPAAAVGPPAVLTAALHPAVVASLAPAVAHPVPPTMHVLRPRGVDRAAVTQLASSSPGVRAALRADGADNADPANPAVATAATATAPFQLVGLTWAAKHAPTGIDISVRVREHGRWGGWQQLGVEDAGPDPDTAEGRAASAIAGSDPLLSLGADGVQVVVHTATGQAPADLKVDLINAGTSSADGATPTPAGATAVAAPASAVELSTTAASAAGSALPSSPPLPPVYTAPGVHTGSQPAPLGTNSPEPVNAAPTVITRAEWGADESIRKPVDFNSTVRAMVIHHTDTTNSYTTLAQAEQQVRAVYAFHVEGRGWSDIGYNFVVDRFGHIFEGRAGSITKAVLGAHTGGFNTDTMGVAALGTFTTATPPKAMVSAIARVVAWKMGQYGSDVNGHVTLTSSGGGTSRYAAGTKVTVPDVTGHRTFGHTTCPGDALWALIPSIRSQATAIIAKQPAGTGYWPVTGVWTAGGGVQPGWFRDGYWSLRRPDGSTLHVRFGKTGDIPVVADWNDDGVTGLGVYRSGTWYLTSELTAQPAHDFAFDYGSGGDLPVVGVWPGQTTLGIGVVDGHTWYLRRTVLGGVGTDIPAFVYGSIGDEPVVADWDGNGTTTPGVLRLGATWFLLDDISNRSVDHQFTYGHFLDTASAADWDVNGSVTPAIVRGDQWFVRNDLLGGVATSITTFAPS